MEYFHFISHLDFKSMAFPPGICINTLLLDRIEVPHIRHFHLQAGKMKYLSTVLARILSRSIN